ncbi:hypothetical protein COV82_03135 [Candidatus Peregrinibacteria bacterium CG11_big_fil_rev_8_21_14_0_20_46_8]|nr:MAG: hypothetical protein COV82_03135 [Candidatus Peregrinibacteria bacterium CG11_big_fil_rev_8_21_14_0_20_46_8]
MVTLFRRVTLLIISSALLFLSAGTASARDAHFQPARGELLTTTVGIERVVVSEEGTLTLFHESGDVAPNYPLLLPNDGLFVSSPLVLDINGDGANEIIVIGRDGAGAHTLYAYRADQTLLGSASITGTIYYDPVALGQSVVVATVSGTIVRFTFQNGAFTSGTLFSLGETAGVTFTGAQQAVVNLPARNQLHVYEENSGTWSRSRIIGTNEPIIYPVELNSTGTTLYGVNRLYQIEAIDFATAQQQSGFPVTTTSAPLDTPVVTELDANSAGDEIAISLLDGSTNVMTAQGGVSAFPVQRGSIGESAVIMAAPGNGNLFVSIGASAGRLMTSVGETIASSFSRIKFALGVTPPTVSAVTAPEILWEAQPNFALTARAADTTANITAAEYYVLPAAGGQAPAPGSATAMTATDGAFDSSEELLQATVDSSAWTVANGPYTLFVRAQDATGDWSEAVSREILVHAFTFESLNVSRASLPADGTTLQTATLVVNARAQSQVNDARILINHIFNENGMPQRGYFRYTPQNGFEELSTAYGNDVVALDPAQSSISFDAGSNQATLVFAWAAQPLYGNVPDNDVSYWWFGLGELWRHVDTSFEVTGSRPLVTLNTVTVGKQTLLADDQDLQEARVVFNATDPAHLGTVSLFVNRDETGGTNQRRGYFEASVAGGFISKGGAYWGQPFVRLLPTSEFITDATAGTVTVVFRWTALPSYGAIASNRITIDWRDSPAPLLTDTTFAITYGTSQPLAFNSLTLAETTVEADATQVQTATLVIDGTPSQLGSATITLNRIESGGDPSEMRGMMTWDGTNFVEGSSYFGNDHINLLTSGANASTVSTTANQTTITFRWTTNSSYDAIASNNISYQLGYANTNTYSEVVRLPNPTFAVTLADPLPTFNALTLSRTSMQANATDIQEATLVIDGAPSQLGSVYLTLNRIESGGDPADMRGQFIWNGTEFLEGPNYFGNGHVNLLTSGANASTITTTANQTTLIFRWTANSSYGAVPVNDISYTFGYANTTNYSPVVKLQSPTFAVTVANAAPAFNSLTFSQPSIEANATDVQEATFTFDGNPADITNVNVILNRTETGEDPANMRGMFKWDGTNFSEGPAYFGSQHVNLLTSGANSSTAVATANQLVLTFRWTTNSTYGNVPTNRVSYSFESGTNNWSPTVRLENPTFAVTSASPIPTFNSLTLSQTSVEANATDIQEATLTLDANPADIDYVSLVLNRIDTGEDPANMRGMLKWDGTNFSKGPAYFGSNHVNLITSGANASTAVINGNQITLTFRWTTNSSYGAIPVNDITYQFGNVAANNYSLPVTLQSPTFAVTLP